MNYDITFDGEPADEDVKVLGDGLQEQMRALFGEPRIEKAAFFVRDGIGDIVGGVYGNYGSFGWLYIDTLWVAERLRGRGYGTRLMHLIEQHASKAGCTDAYLNTFSFQAPDFYQKLGYTTFAQLENFPPGHSRLFMRKKLVHDKTDSWPWQSPL